MKRSLDLNALQTFAVAIHKGSMAKAAIELGLPKSTVSRHLSKIEQAMGVSLVRRVPQGIEPTVEGKLLFDRIADSVSSLQALGAIPLSGDSWVHDYEPFKPLSIRAPMVFGRGFLPDVIDCAISKFPALRFELTLTDRFFDPGDDAYDINFCVGIEVPFEMEVSLLGYLDARLYASPAFLSTRPIETPDDLNNSPLITIPCVADALTALSLTSDRGQCVSLSTNPLVVVNDNAIILHLAEAGHGICRLPAFVAASAVKANNLVEILPGWTVDRHRVALATKRGYRQPIVQAFIDYASEKLSHHLSAEGNKLTLLSKQPA
jgi:DNA-binding transcriptional LysR family regulator